MPPSMPPSNLPPIGPSFPSFTIPVRLLSSVAVVGRDNEPIYLRGDLCDCSSVTRSSPPSPSSPSFPRSSPQKLHHDDGIEGTGNDDGTDNIDNVGNVGSVVNDVNDGEERQNIVSDEEDGGEEGEEDRGGGEEKDGEEGSSSKRKKGLFGRIKGVMGGSITADGGNGDKDGVAQEIHANDAGDGTDGRDGRDGDDEEVDSDDPFGFFGANSGNSVHDGTIGTNGTKPQLAVSAVSAVDGSMGAMGAMGSMGLSAPMSLTQQLVLHASLDRFEEMASRSNKGGNARWRTPGSTGANAMWMGLLCEVEERWNVYGYLTNTGIKFMILVENVCINEDGSRPSSSSYANSLPSSSVSNMPSNRENDLKVMFAKLHELYVRHTMNPFSKLRSPIKSRAFDRGIAEMAQSFNDTALRQVLQVEEDMGRLSHGSLAWM